MSHFSECSIMCYDLVNYSKAKSARDPRSGHRRPEFEKQGFYLSKGEGLCGKGVWCASRMYVVCVTKLCVSNVSLCVGRFTLRGVGCKWLEVL